MKRAPRERPLPAVARHGSRMPSERDRFEAGPGSNVNRLHEHNMDWFNLNKSCFKRYVMIGHAFPGTSY